MHDKHFLSEVSVLWPLVAAEKLQVSGRGKEGDSCTKQVEDSVMTGYALITFFDCIISNSLHINQLQGHFLLGLQSPLLLCAVTFLVILVAGYNRVIHTAINSFLDTAFQVEQCSV